MASERLADAKRRLDVHAGTRLEPAERATAERLGHRVELDLAVVDRDDGEADPREGDRVADRGLGRRLRGRNAETDAVLAALDGDDGSTLAHDAREHRIKRSDRTVGWR